MPDVFGRALLDYQSRQYTEDIITYSSVAGKDILPLPYLFRDYSSMPLIEQKALDLCRGTILDVGCGAGIHALWLQEKGLEVTGLDHSPGAIETCRLRGVKKTLYGTIDDEYGMKFDTVILLMNGVGLAGNMANLNNFLFQLKALLNPNGQILLDSSDIIYMYDDEERSALKLYGIADFQEYYGEVTFTMEYKGIRSDPFDWLYIDFATLGEVATSCGLLSELVMEGDHYDYLARLTAKK